MEYSVNRALILNHSDFHLFASRGKWKQMSVGETDRVDEKSVSIDRRPDLVIQVVSLFTGVSALFGGSNDQIYQ